jgi:ribonucleoside-triphosphate reductase
MNEMCENFMGVNILDPSGRAFALEVGDYIREKLTGFQEACGCLFNYEATPSESTCYRLALLDKKAYPDIITQGSGKDCYYTNSCHIPVSLISDINSTFKHQEPLQAQFTGGTVIHCFAEGAITGEQAKVIVRAMCEHYKVPYMSLSPISRYCDEHGYVKEIVDKCPVCKKRLKLYQRITGYLRCVDHFNRGKKTEFRDRVQLPAMPSR